MIISTFVICYLYIKEYYFHFQCWILIEMTFGQILKEMYKDKENYMMETTTISSFIFYIVNDRRCRMQ